MLKQLLVNLAAYDPFELLLIFDSLKEVPQNETCCSLTVSPINHIGAGAGWTDGWQPGLGKIATSTIQRKVIKVYPL